MKALIERAARAGERRADERLRQLAEAAREALPGDIDVTRDEGRLVISGRALGARMLSDPDLRGIGLLAGRGGR